MAQPVVNLLDQDVATPIVGDLDDSIAVVDLEQGVGVSALLLIPADATAALLTGSVTCPYAVVRVQS
ncbi:hypothetical protein ACU4GR_30120 [Methylobacterium oryzae CBMB20]